MGIRVSGPAFGWHPEDVLKTAGSLRTSSRFVMSVPLQGQMGAEADQHCAAGTLHHALRGG